MFESCSPHKKENVDLGEWLNPAVEYIVSFHYKFCGCRIVCPIALVFQTSQIKSHRRLKSCHPLIIEISLLARSDNRITLYELTKRLINAKVAQLVERNLAKVEVGDSSSLFCSKINADVSRCGNCTRLISGYCCRFESDHR